MHIPGTGLALLVMALLAVAAVANEETSPLPVFAGGHFNITSVKAFNKALKKHPLLLVGFSASSCKHCVDFESEYVNATQKLDKNRLPFARVDLDKLKKLASKYDITALPHIKLFRGAKALTYAGIHGANEIAAYAEKQLAPAVRDLKTAEHIEKFRFDSDIAVIGYINQNDAEEEEMTEFEEAATSLWHRYNVFFGRVTSAELQKLGAAQKWFKRTPAVVLFRNLGLQSEGEKREPDRQMIQLNELSDDSLETWISKHSVRLVDELTFQNFKYYEDLKLPMLMLFVNKSAEFADTNVPILAEFEASAADFQGRISFVFCDGGRFKDQQVSLGLPRGHLPSMAFNTRDARLFPYPIDRKFTMPNIKNFARAYMRGELTPKAASAEVAPPQLGDIVEVIGKTFNEVVMDERKDVILLLYNRADEEETSILDTYYKRIAERFKWRKADTVVVARMDVGSNQIPIDIELHKVPSVVMFPAKDKKAPWRMFHGKFKVRPLMLWVAEHASFDLGFENDTPDLDAEQRKAYEEQLAELNERKRKKKEDEENVKRLKEEWAKEQPKELDDEEEEEEDDSAKDKPEAQAQDEL